MKGYYTDSWLVVYLDGSVDDKGWLRWLSDDGLWCSSHTEGFIDTLPLPCFKDNTSPTQLELDMLKIVDYNVWDR